MGGVKAALKILHMYKNKKERKKERRRKIEKRKEFEKIIDGKHVQHSRSFMQEINSRCNGNYARPFRQHDMVWLFGQYKNIKMDEIPIGYLEWALATFNMSSTTKLIFTTYMNSRLLK